MIVLKLLKALHNQHSTKNFQPQTTSQQVFKKKQKNCSELTADPQWIRVPNTTCAHGLPNIALKDASEHQIREVCHTWLNPPAVVNIPPGLSGECPKHDHRNGNFLNYSSSYAWSYLGLSWNHGTAYKSSPGNPLALRLHFSNHFINDNDTWSWQKCVIGIHASEICVYTVCMYICVFTFQSAPITNLDTAPPM